MTDQPASLAEALLELQGRLPAISKSKTAKVQSRDSAGYAYRYADLSVITKKMLPILGELGLTWTCRPTMVDGKFVLAYALTHVATGEAAAGEYPLPTSGTPQQVGAALTYARRYALTAVTGLCPDDDDTDAAAAHDDRPAQSRERRVRNGDDEPADEGLLRGMFADLSRHGYRDKEASLGFIISVIGREIASRKELRRGEVVTVRRALREAENDNHDEAPSGETR